MKLLIVPGTKIRFRYNNGWESSDDSGQNWYFTFRNEQEIRHMWPSIEQDEQIDEEQSERELYGETLDEPLPDDLYEFITSL